VNSGGLTFITPYSGGNTSVCLEQTSQSGGVLATCGSSLRYKKDLVPFVRGLELLNGLRPISFTWKSDGTRDVGLGAEEVAKVEPILVTRNAKGEVEGVKYDRLTTVLVNAIKEQQKEIEQQHKQVETLTAENAALSARLQAVEKHLRNRSVSARRRR
jgi:hypothetical protein